MVTYPNLNNLYFLEHYDHLSFLKDNIDNLKSIIRYFISYDALEEPENLGINVL